MTVVSAVSPLYADTLTIGPLSDLLSSTVTTQTQPNRFWATVQRDINDVVLENIDFKFTSARLINTLQFDHSHFPHQLYIEWMDTSGNWNRLTQDGSTPYFFSVGDSIPAVCNTQAILSDKTANPEHTTDPKHWITRDLIFPPVNATRVRLVLQRRPGGGPGQGPPVWNGKLQPYSLAIRNFNAGYVISSVKDIPIDAFNSGNTFASSTDLLGSRVQFSVYREKASDIFQNKVWRCEPQPTKSAIVNFYVDVRDAAGAAQLIDQFYVDPLYIGPTVNVYYSNDTLSGSFEAIDDALSYPVVKAQGPVEPYIGYNVMEFDTTGPSYVDIDNSGVQFDVTQPWWMGIDLFSRFASNGSGQSPIIDTGQFSASFSGNNVIIQTVNHDYAEIPVNFGVNTEVQVFLFYQPVDTDEFAAGLYVTAGVAGEQTYTNYTALSSPFKSVADIRLGGYQVGGEGTPGFGLQSFVLKQESFTNETMNAYQQAGGLNYVRKPFYAGDVDNTPNSLVRFNAQFTGNLNPLGFVGGPGVPYSNVNWTPVLRQFKLAKGYMQLPPTKAKFFKFEMSNLVAEQYEVYQPVSSTVQIFNTYIQNATPTPSPNSSAVDAVPGLATSVGLANTNTYADSPSPNTITTAAGIKYGPTSALVSNSPDVAAALAKTSWAYGFQTWQKAPTAPVFQNAGTHEYQIINIKQVNKVAYFTGLKELQALRVSFIAGNDTSFYDEHFHDLTNIQTSSWIINNNSLSTISGQGTTYAVAQSVPYASTRAVKGVQFAAQQSDAVLLNTNDNFGAAVVDGTVASEGLLPSSSLYPNSTTYPSGETLDVNGSIVGFSDYGDASISQTDQFECVVQRVAPYTWGDLNGQLYSQLDTLTYGGIERLSQKGPQDIGGIVTEMVTPSDAGRINAAVRFTAPNGLTSPLFLQIIDSTGTILAETEINAAIGQTVEAFCGYEVGSVNKATPKTWGDVENYYHTGTPMTYGQLNTLTYSDFETTPYVGPVQARLVQFGRSSDIWTVNALSIFDEGILWEFSNDAGANWYPAIDIRNNPNGVLIFPDLGVTTPTPTLMWRVRAYRQGVHVSALRVRPWYAGLMSGIPANKGISPPGPNISPYDHYSDVRDDPQFMVSHDPIPSWWHTNGRPILSSGEGTGTGGDYVYVPPTPGSPEPAQFFIQTYDDITIAQDFANTNRGPWHGLARVYDDIRVTIGGYDGGNAGSSSTSDIDGGNAGSTATSDIDGGTAAGGGGSGIYYVNPDSVSVQKRVYRTTSEHIPLTDQALSGSSGMGLFSDTFDDSF